ncbi:MULTISPECIES: IclR family transcriptional regulator C-terminal domain-containing protein [Streptomyces]|uniref:IclR family transcriptional regulator C-terminal domain-containing protein n=1 Tax=Streptomyces TaxID=1883 RepID=UPI001F223075|nr:IclR family transcriptional regulator C-terminal domain-containing protein [Streptomyces sp. SID2888]
MDLRRAVLTGPLERRTPHTVVTPGILRRQLQQVTQTGIASERQELAVTPVRVATPALRPQDQGPSPLILDTRDSRS